MSQIDELDETLIENETFPTKAETNGSLLGKRSDLRKEHFRIKRLMPLTRYASGVKSLGKNHKKDEENPVYYKIKHKPRMHSYLKRKMNRKFRHSRKSANVTNRSFIRKMTNDWYDLT
jgi:hypothetical protein